MASSVIFSIIRIIFKYGRAIIMLYGLMIGGCGHNGEQHLLLYDVSALHTVLVHPSYEGGHHPVAAASDPPDKTDTPLIITTIFAPDEITIWIWVFSPKKFIYLWLAFSIL
jgi:hypothetical protein